MSLPGEPQGSILGGRFQLWGGPDKTGDKIAVIV